MQGGGPQWTSEIWYGPGDTTGFPYAPKLSATNLQIVQSLSVDRCVEIIHVQIPQKIEIPQKIGVQNPHRLALL